MTINPFNVDPVSGEPRSRMQIVAALREMASDWIKVPAWCAACRGTALAQDGKQK
jgi:hypothetical protein